MDAEDSSIKDYAQLHVTYVRFQTIMNSKIKQNDVEKMLYFYRSASLNAIIFLSLFQKVVYSARKILTNGVY